MLGDIFLASGKQYPQQWGDPERFLEPVLHILDTGRLVWINGQGWARIEKGRPGKPDNGKSRLAGLRYGTDANLSDERQHIRIHDTYQVRPQFKVHIRTFETAGGYFEVTGCPKGRQDLLSSPHDPFLLF